MSFLISMFLKVTNIFKGTKEFFTGDIFFIDFPTKSKVENTNYKKKIS